MSLVQPEPVPLTVGGVTLATAYARRPPGRRKGADEGWSWEAKFKDKASGAWVTKSLGRLADADVPTALVDLYRGVDPAAVRVDGGRISTVGDLCRAYYADLETRGPDSGARAEHRLSDRTLKNYLGNAQRVVAVADRMPLADLASGGVFVIKDASRVSYAPRTVQADLKYLRQAVLWGRERGVEVVDVSTRRAARLMTQAELAPVNVDRTPTHEEVERVWSSVRRSMLRLGIYIGWKTGARIGEITAVRPCDLYEDRDGAWVGFPKGKTGPRRFPLTLEELATIRTMIPAGHPEDTPLFGRHFARNGTEHLKIACLRLGIQAFTFHGLRDLMCDTCHRRGVEIGAYVEMLGHSAQTALEHYRRPTVDDVLTARRRISGLDSKADVLGWLAANGIDEAEAVRVLAAWRQGRSTG